MNNNKIQKELVKEILVACDNGDVQQVKSLINKIDLDCEYSATNDIPVQIYCRGCLSWNIGILDELIKIPRSYDKDNHVMHSAFKTLINSNNVNSHKIIIYLMNDPKLKKNRIRCRGYDSVLFKSIINAAQKDDTSIFKIILNLDDPKHNNKRVFESLLLLRAICSNNKASIMRYICNEPRLSEKVSPELGFHFACDYKNLALLQYFIFEYKIRKPNAVDDPNMEGYSEEATRMFELRKLNNQLNIVLQPNQELSKKIKV